MAKAKKAAPKKASSKKPIAKKSTPKKATVKKAAPGKASAKKIKAPKPPKVTNKKTKAAKKAPKAAAKSKAPEKILEQNFMDSLASLESFWSKKVMTLKKECDTLVSKHKKETQQKLSPKQAEKLNSLEKGIADKQDALDEASLAAAKFAALRQKINDFENEWLHQFAGETLKAASPVAHKAPVQKIETKNAAAKLTEDLENRQHDWEDEPQTEDTQSDDLEDIFMPQDDLSEFEVIEDFSVTSEDDLYEDDE